MPRTSRKSFRWSCHCYANALTMAIDTPGVNLIHESRGGNLFSGTFLASHVTGSARHTSLNPQLMLYSARAAYRLAMVRTIPKMVATIITHVSLLMLTVNCHAFALSNRVPACQFVQIMVRAYGSVLCLRIASAYNLIVWQVTSCSMVSAIPSSLIEWPRK